MSFPRFYRHLHQEKNDEIGGQHDHQHTTGLYSRAVVGWAMGSQLTGVFTQQALQMALQRGLLKAGLLYHSDRGSQYTAIAYQQALTAAGITVSMSWKGNCWDNACIESFFRTVKREPIHHRHYRTREEEAKQEIFESSKCFITAACHSTLGYRSPAEFEAKAAVAWPGFHEIGERSL